MLGFRLSNFIRICIVISVLIVGVLFFIASLANVNLSYTKRNFIYYHTFTFDEIKNIPLISNNYIIYYDSPDGSQIMTNEIVFSNVNLIRKKELIEYVENMGFKKYFDKYWNEDSWRKDNVRISIKQNDTERTILFLVEIS
ncbi:DUF1139 domain-containing protein [Xenorhabdus bovienii]|uniref:DUF1139 domain-containing protein n=1 Tax=Xenorhabdus bovienii TaxID=40576 RepID=A0AAJ1MXK2_XENBV|nr:DUF1139 domain-containing protein [Xenorhabdus bovienii]MDE1474233.1 DUF1139 domain-containing protein [Xenorhabdus bovienii]MDE1477369.1 DUF1139 domain-containing protein [Xenorhabdus bovienii]MDE1480921.1 DUF1139 domain-containing protein [Xenorhabdus bovienii]MDE1485594.1 DUF1139 domain-containing protein [Xenorhabdus bovienii]MDE1489566.1 DUF1139 domain-containing protein [Xenorhabdus bovienii]